MSAPIPFANSHVLQELGIGTLKITTTSRPIFCKKSNGDTDNGTLFYKVATITILGTDF